MVRGIVYRWGSRTDDALTTRIQDVETPVEPGKRPGLSVWINPPTDGRKAQGIDIALLEAAGLRYWPDDPTRGGEAGHGVIAPVNAEGELDMELLRDWSRTRGMEEIHRLTVTIRNAIVEPDVRRLP